MLWIGTIRKKRGQWQRGCYFKTHVHIICDIKELLPVARNIK